MSKKVPTQRFSNKDTSNFNQVLRQRVNDYFKSKNISQNGNLEMYFKTLVITLLYSVPFVLVYMQAVTGWATIGLYAISGFGFAGVGLCIMHDANHGAYSTNKFVNTLMSFSMNIVGYSMFNWKIQHNQLHHTYTNIYGLDEDIADKPLIKLSPYGKHTKMHKYQHIYAPFLYSFATLNWFLTKDYKQLIAYNKVGLTEKSGGSPVKEMIYLIASKAVYAAVMLGLPIYLGVPVWTVLLGYLTMHMVAGLVITVIFQLAHVVEETDHYTPNPEGPMDNTWAIHQLHTTSNFACNNPFINWYCGGLNFQVEHHLFPSICHVHYKEVSKIVKETAHEFGIPYHEHKTFTGAFISHLKTLKKFGSQELEAPTKKKKEASMSMA